MGIKISAPDIDSISTDDESPQNNNNNGIEILLRGSNHQLLDSTTKSSNQQAQLNVINLSSNTNHSNVMDTHHHMNKLSGGSSSFLRKRSKSVSEPTTSDHHPHSNQNNESSTRVTITDFTHAIPSSTSSTVHNSANNTTSPSTTIITNNNHNTIASSSSSPISTAAKSSHCRSRSFNFFKSSTSGDHSDGNNDENNEETDDGVFSTLQSASGKSCFQSNSNNKAQVIIPPLQITMNDMGQLSQNTDTTSKASPHSNGGMSNRTRSFRSISIASLLSIGTNNSSHQNGGLSPSTTSMHQHAGEKTPRGAQYSIYSKAVANMVSPREKNLNRIENCRLVVLVGGIDSGKTTLLQQMRSHNFTSAELKSIRDSILIYCIYYLKVLVSSQHEVNLNHLLHNSSPEFIENFSNLYQQFQTMISPKTGNHHEQDSSPRISPLSSPKNNSTDSFSHGLSSNSTDANSSSSSTPRQLAIISRLWKQKEFFKVMQELWKHPLVQKSYRERNLRKIPTPLLGENIEYFLQDGRIEKLKKVNAMTCQDMIRAKTLTIESMPVVDFTHLNLEHDGSYKTRKFLLFETLGWRDKRDTQIAQQNFLEKPNLDCIVFMVPLSEIDLVCFEDLISPSSRDSIVKLGNSNRLLDSLQYFEQVLTKIKTISDIQRQQHIRKILLFTKVDVFIQKIRNGDAIQALSKFFSDFTGNKTNPYQVFNYIRDRFVSVHNRCMNENGNSTNVPELTMHVVNLLESFDIKEVFDSITMNVNEMFVNCELSSLFHKQHIFNRRILYKWERSQFTDIEIRNVATYTDLDYI
ncbi:hypothetical protein C9374_012906 [Naegleria lovaniensis]|uniref:Uncharacterized protein n=1 Tax=Naegleria lovaniensis TaxID=51637 RepID=A0AA88GCP3_NAELO|nr:uncharacterized protein C9374_012906 [Naegleria lovaniensis]KAG2373060.1 hypothetical protein C9374_012906 [Naegleria lovaniensis]